MYQVGGDLYFSRRIFYLITIIHFGFHDSSIDKESACNAGDPSLIPGLERFPWRRDRLPTPVLMGFPGGSDSKEYACNVGVLGSISGLGRSPGERHGNPLQYSCLENPMNREAWQATVYGVAKSWTRLSD